MVWWTRRWVEARQGGGSEAGEEGGSEADRTKEERKERGSEARRRKRGSALLTRRGIGVPARLQTIRKYEEYLYVHKMYECTLFLRPNRYSGSSQTAVRVPSTRQEERNSTASQRRR